MRNAKFRNSRNGCKLGVRAYLFYEVSNSVSNLVSHFALFQQSHVPRDNSTFRNARQRLALLELHAHSGKKVEIAINCVQFYGFLVCDGTC